MMLILKGKFYAYKSTLDDLKTAMHDFELAKERDPEFALAFAGIAKVWMFRQQMGLHPLTRQAQK